MKSPLKIMDLTRYTKQVAAYGIETEKLFDTTKRLADVSVGLGVDMGRIVLAYGQVKAASYLRAAEVRQFTEAGIPMLELLAKKLTGMNGELVTTADVMDMISKRGVGFEMVEKIFEDLTSKGGMFYNMQEKQGNTLYGMWSKLGDAASMMYDEIGNTGPVQDGMKDLIGMLSTLMQHWRGVAGAMATGGLLWGVKGLHSMGGKIKDAAGKQYEAAVTARIEAEARLEAAQITRNEAEIVAANRALETAKANETAAASENRRAQSSSKMGVAFRSMWKSILAGVGITAVIGLVAGLVGWLTEAIAASGKLKKELDGIDAETRGTIEKATYNFKRLADAATEAATGSKKQRDALEELQRTYGNIIGPEELQIDRLKRMKDEGYGPLVQMIKEYNWAIAQKKKLDAVTDHYTKDIVDAERDIREAMKEGAIWAHGEGFTKIKFTDDEISRVLAKMEELAETTTLDYGTIMGKALEEVLEAERYSYHGSSFNTGSFFGNIKDVVEKTRQMNAELRGIETSMREQTGKYGEWGKALAAVGDEVDKMTMKNSKGEAVSADSALGKRLQNNARIQLYTRNIKAAFEDVGITWKEEWAKVEQLADDNAPLTSRMDFSALVNAVDANEEALGNNYEQLRNTVTAYQGEYENIVPSNKTVQAMRKALKDIASTDEWLRTYWDMSPFEMAADESWEDYSKRIRDSRKQLETELQEYRKTNSVTPGSYSEDEMKVNERTVWALQEMERYLKQKGGVHTGDGRAGILQEMAQGLEQIYEQYEKLKQSHGAEEALKKTQEMYRSTLWEMEERNKKYDFGFGEWEIPTSAEELWQDLQEIQDVMARLPKGERPSLELQVKIDKMKSEALVKAMAKRLKELGERVARTKEAREFYNKLVGETGDVDTARVVTDRIYGSWGETLFDDTVSEIKALAGEGIDLTGAIDTVNARIDYRELELIYLEHKERIVEANRATLEKIIADGKKATAEEIAGWEGALAKAKSFESRRTAVILRESEERAKMLRNAALSEEQRRELMDASRKRENKELAEIDVEEFKSSDDYVKVFEEMDRVSEQTLRRMRERIEGMIEAARVAAPKQVKELQKALDRIDDEMGKRGFGNRIGGAVKSLLSARKRLRAAQTELTAAQAEKDETGKAVREAEDEHMAALIDQQRVNGDLASTDEDRLRVALAVNSAEKGVKLAKEKQAKAGERVKKAQEGVSNATNETYKAGKDFQEDLNYTAREAQELASLLDDVKDLLGVSEDSAAGIAFDSAVTGLQTMAKTLTTVTAAIELMNIISESNPWVVAAAALMAVTVALGSFLAGNKVRKANREIERQQEALDALTHSYERLEAAEERAFGSERITSYRKRLENLRAQEAAYRKQAEAERSKGKSADKDKVKDYEDSAREAMEKIADMRTELQEYFAGTDLTSAAREFAEAWIDARVQFENTTDAMREKFGDMIKNMVVEAMAAKLMETSLRPFYESIEKAAEDGVVTAAEVAATAKIGLGSIDTMNRSMEVMWAELSKAGLDAGKVWGDAEGTFHGIARDIASASEEDINGLAAGVNVANYYMSRLPGIGADVAAIRVLLAQRDSVGGAGADMAGLVAIQNEAIAQRRAIEANTALTAQRCGELVGKVEAIATLLGRVVKPNGTSSGWGVIVR